jgi:hypothetical protein
MGIRLGKFDRAPREIQPLPAKRQNPADAHAPAIPAGFAP